MTESSFELACPRCSATLTVPADRAGLRIDCPSCKHSLLVPGEAKTQDKVTIKDLVDVDDGVLDDEDSLPIANRTEDSGDEADALDTVVPSSTGTSGSTEAPLLIDDDILFEDGPQEDSEGDLDELLPLDPKPGKAAASVDPKDPFEVDLSAPLRIDGITPSDNTQSVRCKLCGSLVYGTPSQMGHHLRCPDCHSMVLMEADERSDQSKQGSVHPDIAPPNQGDEFRLSPLIERPVAGTRLNPNSDDVDGDKEVFSKHIPRTLEPLPPELDDSEAAAASESIESDSSAGSENRGMDVIADLGTEEEYGLAPPDTDLLKPTFDYTLSSDSEPSAVSVSAPERVAPRDRSGKRVPKETPPVEPESVDPPATFAFGEEIYDLVKPLEGWSGWLGTSIKRLGNKEIWVRGVFCSLGLGLAFWLMKMAVSYFGQGGLAFFFGFVLLCLSGVVVLLSFGFLMLMANMIIRCQLARGDESMLDWSDFSFADWFSQLLFVGTSLLIGTLPGFALGQVLLVATGSSSIMLILTSLSFFIVTPLFMAAVVYNDSAFSLFSDRAFQSLGGIRNRWLRFLVLALACCVITCIATLSYFSVNSAAVGFVFAVLLVFVLLVYFHLLGDHVADVVQYMVYRSEQS